MKRFEKAVARRLRENLLAESWVYRHGRAVRRIPKDVRRRAITQDRIPGLAGSTTWCFGAEELVIPTSPATVARPSTLSPLALRRHLLPAPFVAELPNAWLVGRHAVPFTRDGRMLLTGFRDALPLVALEPHPELEAWAGRRWTAAGQQHDFEGLARNPVVSMVGRLDSNYFHWLVDFCGQLEGLGEYRRLKGEELSVLVRANAPSFVRESLGILGIEATQIAEWPLQWRPELLPTDEDFVAVPVPRLVVSSWRGYRHGSSARSLAWLRSQFMTDVPPPRFEPESFPTADRATDDELKVYVQRPSTGWRVIENEQEVREALESEGFLVFRPEAHSVEEQISLFARATVIVGMHGAALTNILFAPNAHLIELVGTYGGPEYFSICRGLGNRYTRVQCLPKGQNIVVGMTDLSLALRQS